MRLSYLAPLCLVALTPLAHADTYQFNFSGQEGACDVDGNSCYTYTAQWQLTSTPDTYTSTTATYNNTSVSGNGIDFLPLTAILYEDGSTGGQEIDFNDPDFGNTDLLFNTFLPSGTFFSGPTSSPAFLVGSYGASLYLQGLSDSLYGTAVITDLDAPSTMTPEPSSLLLLGTGVLGAAGALRRRLSRAR